MTLKQKLTELANSEKAKELQAKAKKIANDPETREKIEAVKQKFAEKRGGGSGAPASTPPSGTTTPAAGGGAGTAPPDSGGDRAA